MQRLLAEVSAVNAYGRYVQSTAFAALDTKNLNRVVPLVVREAINYPDYGKSRSETPTRSPGRACASRATSYSETLLGDAMRHRYRDFASHPSPDYPTEARERMPTILEPHDLPHD